MSRRSFTFAVVFSMTTGLLAACGGGGGSSSTIPLPSTTATGSKAPAPIPTPTSPSTAGSTMIPMSTSYTPAPSMTSAPGQLALLSDHTVSLTHAGTTEQIVAPAEATFTSTNPSVATVSSTGLITAVSSGLALIQIDAIGKASDAVAVTVALQATSTVGLPSSDVQSVSGSQVVLLANADTQPIVVGSYVVSGDNAGLIGQVTALTRNSSTVIVTLASASVIAAFPNSNFSEDVDLGTVSMAASDVRTRGGFAATPAPTPEPSTSSPCSGGLMKAFSPSIFTQNYHFVYHRSFSTMGGQLNAMASVSYTLQFGTSQNASIGLGDLGATGSCDFLVTTFTTPPIPLGETAAFLQLIFTPTVGGKLAVGVTTGSSVPLPLPVVTLGTSGTVGFAIVNGTLMNVTSFGPLTKNVVIKPLTVSFVGGGMLAATADTKLPVAASVYFAKFIRVTPENGVPLGALELDGNFNVALVKPFSSMRYGYLGPTWDFDVNGSYNVPSDAASLYNKIAKVFNLTPIPPSDAVPFPTATLASQPTIGLTTSVDTNGCISLNASATDTNAFPIQYTGDNVNFDVSTDDVSTRLIAVSTVGTATTWAPSNPGTYMLSAQIPVWQYLPYASPPQAVTVTQAHPACASSVTGTGPGASPVPTPIGTATPNPSGSPGAIYFSPQSLDFPDVGSSFTQTLDVSQSDYTNKWSESDTCSGVVTITGSFTAPSSQLSITPVAPGNCYVNIYDTGGTVSGSGSLEITVETTTVSPNRKGRK